MGNLVIYRITNTKNRRFYIGSTGSFLIRKAEHLGQLRTNKHCNSLLQRDFIDFKESSFLFEVIEEEFKTRNALLLREYELIIKGKRTGMCYNIDTNCPVLLPAKEGRGKWKVYKKPFVPPPNTRVKIKRKQQYDQAHRDKINHPHLDSLTERKKEREENKRRYDG